MAKQEVKIIIEASNVLEAESIRQGIQAVVDELGEHKDFLIQLAQPGVAKDYKKRIDAIMKNPLFRTLANKF